MYSDDLNVKAYYEAGDFLITEKTTRPDYPLHWHNNFELELVLDGEGENILNGTKYPLCKGALYIMNPTDFHEFHSVRPVRLINIRFSENVVSSRITEKFLNYKENAVFYVNGAEYDEIYTFLKALMREYNEKQDGYETVIANILECIFVSLSRKMKHSCNNSPKKEGVIQKSILYLHKHFRENPSLEAIADVFAINPNYFSSLFHKETKMTYKQYVTMLKVRYAKKLVQSTTLSITEICYASGFSSLSHFLRVFKEQMGATPSEIRAGKKASQ